MTVPPHLGFLAALAKANVDYLLIGMMGLNHYAERPGDVFHTEDVDVLIAPRADGLRRACAALTRAGYELESNGEALGTVDAFLARRIVERRAVITGRHEHGLGVDIVLEARPYTFAQWRRFARRFRVDDIQVVCASQEMILRAKADAGRPKDKAFLKIYEASRPKAAKKRKGAP
ncbi:MAG: hypothetical protein FD126_1236 [Elusimicrobia bacterium]|nr:MAG: hypothetical protein FD126_1236 [Elusimicrobiota bacterium]